jgi:hypothetical protein
MTNPTPGSVWTADRIAVRVIAVVELEGNIWIHFRSEPPGEPREYSCYLASFLERYREQQPKY